MLKEDIMKENGKMERKMGKVDSNLQMEVSMMESSRRARFQVAERERSRTIDLIQVNFYLENFMEREFTWIQM